MNVDWMLIYQIGVGFLVAGYLFSTALFAILGPDDTMERLTFINSAALLAAFSTLGYWLITGNDIENHPHVYPPLVLAFWIAAITNIGFTAVAWRDWLSRR
jgi:hypothetical protein